MFKCQRDPGKVHRVNGGENHTLGVCGYSSLSFPRKMQTWGPWASKSLPAVDEACVWPEDMRSSWCGCGYS